jgi:hypothetical protein
MNYLVKSVLKNSTFVSNMSYDALLTQANLLYPIAGPILLHFFCMCYNLLDTTKKTELNNFMYNQFNEYYFKYEILTTLCKNEQINPMQFITTNKKYIEPVLVLLKIKFPTTEDEFKKALDNNINNIKGLIQQQQQILAVLNVKGGKTRKLRKKLKYLKKYKTKK